MDLAAVGLLRGIYKGQGWFQIFRRNLGTEEESDIFKYIYRYINQLDISFLLKSQLLLTVTLYFQ